jgi:hypothetical protein
MLKLLLRLLGMRALKSAVAGGKRPPILDFGLGMKLFKDRRVPVGSKVLSLALGVIAIAVLNVLELPVEALIAAVLNLPGIGFDILLSGVEILAGPFLLGALFLMRLAPRQLVAQARQERYGMLNSSTLTR